VRRTGLRVICPSRTGTSLPWICLAFFDPLFEGTIASALCGSQGLAGLSESHRPTLTLTAAPGRGSHQGNRFGLRSRAGLSCSAEFQEARPTRDLPLARDPTQVSGDVFYKMSRVYEKLGRYCDGITPIETYIALDPANRRTPQTLKIIAEYAEKGNCDTHYASGTARIPILGGTGVHSLTADVNGVSGNFILDIGATFVSVTSQFASKARVSTQPGNQMIMKTVGGTALPEIKYANTIRVGRAEASGVVVAVLGDATNPFSSGADGLLGMSFLARFKLNVSQTGIELTPVPLH
jgi:predicted aspartyl protease